MESEERMTYVSFIFTWPIQWTSFYLSLLVLLLFLFLKTLVNNRRVDNGDNTKDKYFSCLLPNEVVVRIFSFLNQQDLTKRICLVNHKFRDLSRSPSLWTEMSDFHSGIFDLYKTATFFGNCKMLTILDLGNVSVTPVPLAIQALKVCQQLSCLKVGHLKESDDFGALLVAVGASNSLREISLEGQWDPNIISDNARCLQSLVEITLKTQTGLDSKSLMAIGKHCQSLLTLDFELDSSYIPFDVTDMNNFVASVKGTIQVFIIRCLHMRGYTALHQKLVECQQLTELGLNNITPTLLMSISYMSGLQWLSFTVDSSSLHKVTAEDYIRTFRNRKLQNLETLDVFDYAINDHVLMTVAQNCPRLTRLVLYMCSNITDTGLGEVLQKCKKLRELSVPYISGITRRAFSSMDANPCLRSLAINSDPNRPCIDKNELAAIQELMPQLNIFDEFTASDWSYQAHGGRQEESWWWWWQLLNDIVQDYFEIDQ